MTLSKKNITIIVGFVLLAAVAGGIVLALNPDLFRQALSIVDIISTWCSSNPVFLFLAIAILPAFGFPASPLLILAGIVWGSTWQACALSILAVASNMTWTFFAASGPGSSLVKRLLGARWERWRNIHPSNLRRFTVLLRITPGIPFFIQNYALGLIGVPFITYILISLPLNGILVVGFVLTGGAIFEGNVGVIFAGVAILMAAIFGLRMLRSKLKPVPAAIQQGP